MHELSWNKARFSNWLVKRKNDIN